MATQANITTAVSNVLFSKHNINIMNSQLIHLTKQENASQDRKKAIFKLLITTMNTVYKQGAHAINPYTFNQNKVQLTRKFNDKVLSTCLTTFMNLQKTANQANTKVTNHMQRQQPQQRQPPQQRQQPQQQFQHQQPQHMDSMQSFNAGVGNQMRHTDSLHEFTQQPQNGFVDERQFQQTYSATPNLPMKKMPSSFPDMNGMNTRNNNQTTKSSFEQVVQQREAQFALQRPSTPDFAINNSHQPTMQPTIQPTMQPMQSLESASIDKSMNSNQVNTIEGQHTGGGEFASLDDISNTIVSQEDLTPPEDNLSFEERLKMIQSERNKIVDVPNSPPQQMQQPSIQQPSIQQPSMQQPSMQQPSMQQPSMQASMQQPSMQSSPMQQPSMQQPSMQASMQQPSMQSSSMQQPSMQQPSMQSSSIQQPSMQQPSMQPPSMQPPSMQPPSMQPSIQASHTRDHLELLEKIAQLEKENTTYKTIYHTNQETLEQNTTIIKSLEEKLYNKDASFEHAIQNLSAQENSLLTLKQKIENLIDTNIRYVNNNITTIILDTRKITTDINDRVTFNLEQALPNTNIIELVDYTIPFTNNNVTPNNNTLNIVLDNKHNISLMIPCNNYTVTELISMINNMVKDQLERQKIEETTVFKIMATNRVMIESSIPIRIDMDGLECSILSTLGFTEASEEHLVNGLYQLQSIMEPRLMVEDYVEMYVQYNNMHEQLFAVMSCHNMQKHKYVFKQPTTLQSISVIFKKYDKTPYLFTDTYYLLQFQVSSCNKQEIISF